MRVRHLAAGVLASLVLQQGAEAAPSSHNFQGTLTAAVNGSTDVSGSFSFDSATNTVTSASIQGGGKTFTAANSGVIAFTATSPAGDFYRFSLPSSTNLSDLLLLVFDAAFTTFYPQMYSAAGDIQDSYIWIDGPTFFVSGTVSAVAAPEPASLALLGAGLLGLGVLRRNRLG